MKPANITSVQVANAARYQNILGMVNPVMFRDRARVYCRFHVDLNFFAPTLTPTLAPTLTPVTFSLHSSFGDSFMHFFNFVCGST